MYFKALACICEIAIDPMTIAISYNNNTIVINSANSIQNEPEIFDNEIINNNAIDIGNNNDIIDNDNINKNISNTVESDKESDEEININSSAVMQYKTKSSRVSCKPTTIPIYIRNFWYMY